MTDKLQTALNNVDMTYNDLVEIANNIVENDFRQVNSIVGWLTNNTNNMTTEQLRDAIVHLQLNAFTISEIKERSSLKADLSDAILKEKFAITFNSLDGSAAVKERQAVAATSEETLTKALYNLVANLYKNKVDQIHRLVDALKSVLMSRMQETKFMQVGTTSEISSTTNPSGTINLHNIEERRGN